MNDEFFKRAGASWRNKRLQAYSDVTDLTLGFCDTFEVLVSAKSV